MPQLHEKTHRTATLDMKTSVAWACLTASCWKCCIIESWYSNVVKASCINAWKSGLSIEHPFVCHAWSDSTPYPGNETCFLWQQILLAFVGLDMNAPRSAHVTHSGIKGVLGEKRVAAIHCHQEPWRHPWHSLPSLCTNFPEQAWTALTLANLASSQNLLTCFSLFFF